MICQWQKGPVRRFEDPRPVREISLVAAATYPRKKLLKQIREEILSTVPIETNGDDKRVLKVKFEEE